MKKPAIGAHDATSPNEIQTIDAAVLCGDADLSELLLLLLEDAGYSAAAVDADTVFEARMAIVSLEDEVLPNPAGRCRCMIGISPRGWESAEQQLSGKPLEQQRKKFHAILPRPFDFFEFSGVVREAYESAVRQPPQSTAEPHNPAFELYEKERLVKRGKKSVRLTPNEFAIISRLISERGKPVSRAELATLIGESDSNKSDVYICTMRKKLEDAFGQRLIVTVRNGGYMI